MYELPWFKTETNIFSNRKIQLILKLTDGDTYFRVWIQLIALAVECNNKGRLEIGGNNPMTIENFSKIMGKSKKKIEKILSKFLELEMLIKEGETFLIKNWDKYQSIENYENGTDTSIGSTTYEYLKKQLENVKFYLGTRFA